MIFVTWDVFVTEYKQMKHQLLKRGSQVWLISVSAKSLVLLNGAWSADKCNSLHKVSVFWRTFISITAAVMIIMVVNATILEISWRTETLDGDKLESEGQAVYHVHTYNKCTFRCIVEALVQDRDRLGSQAACKSVTGQTQLPSSVYHQSVFLKTHPQPPIWSSSPPFLSTTMSTTSFKIVKMQTQKYNISVEIDIC